MIKYSTVFLNVTLSGQYSFAGQNGSSLKSIKWKKRFISHFFFRSSVYHGLIAFTLINMTVPHATYIFGEYRVFIKNLARSLLTDLLKTPHSQERTLLTSNAMFLHNSDALLNTIFSTNTNWQMNWDHRF